MANMKLKRDAKPYKLLGKGKGVKKHKLIPALPADQYVGKGSKFNGEVIYLRMPSGFEKVVKVKDKVLTYYHFEDVDVTESFTGDVEEIKTPAELEWFSQADGATADEIKAKMESLFAKIENRIGRMMTPKEKAQVLNKIRTKRESQKFAYGLPQAGKIAAFEPRMNSDFLEAGIIKGALATAPRINDVWSHFTGDNTIAPKYGVQAGQIWQPHRNQDPNHYQLEAGQIEGIHDTDSHVYNKEQYSGTYGLEAGVAYDWGGNDAPNSWQLEAGEIKGFKQTMPDSYSYTNGAETDEWYNHDYGRAYRYPNMLSYGLANPNWQAALPEYSEGYPQYNNANFSGADGDKKGIFAKIGDWFKKDEPIGEDKVEFTEQEVHEIYNKSGSRKSFGQWLNSNEGISLANNITALTSILLGKNRVSDVPDEEVKPEQKDLEHNSGQKKKILGMHPITFGVVASLVLIGGVVTTVLLTKKKK